MAETATASPAYENPLIPNARLRQIYLAMVRARLLEKALPAARRGHVVAAGSSRGHAVGMPGLEACLISPAVDLGPEDMVSDALAGGMVEFLRGAGLGQVLKGETVGAKRGAREPFADCGTAARLPAAPGIAERLWVAGGAALALKASAARAKSEAKAEDEKALQLGVVVVYARPGEVSDAVWRRMLDFAAEQELPIVFMLLPARGGGGTAGSAKAGGVSALALRCGVPGIAVDADDAVAIYRVAQESIGRARAGGGAALMECMPYVLAGVAGKGASKQDAIATMEEYLLQRRVATRQWMQSEARSFARRLGIKST